MRLTDEQKKEMDQRHPKGAEWRREKPPTDATKQLKAQIRKKTRAAAAKPPKPAPTIAKKIAKTSAEKPPAAAKPIESAKEVRQQAVRRAQEGGCRRVSDRLG